jgi:hypothetical protein
LVGAPGSANAERDPGHPTTTQGSKEDVVRHGGAGSRGRYLPMLGDRAGE